MRPAAIDGIEMHCMPFSYPCPMFDRSLLADSYRGIGERIYGHPERYYLDDEGRQWVSAGLTGISLARYFLQNPTRYLALLQHRVSDFAVLQDKLREAHTLLTASTTSQLARAIRLASEAYVLVLKYFHVSQLVVEYWCRELRTVILRHLPQREANSYLTSMLEAPAAAEAIKCGFTEDAGSTGRIDAVKSSPMLMFAATIFPRAVAMDAKLHDKILRSNDSLADFWSLRTLTPLAVQLAEESRYADYSVRTHLKHFLARVHEYNSTVSDPYELEWRHLVALLEGDMALQI